LGESGRRPLRTLTGKRHADPRAWARGLLARAAPGAAGTRALADGLPLEYAQGTAEDFARQAGAGALVRPGAAWRGAPASEKQCALLRKWRVPIPADMTKGAAADAITAHLAARP
jgi:hypothetical protein